MSIFYRHEIVGVFGCPVDENPTGIMEEAAFRAKNLPYRYQLFYVEPQDLEAAVKGIRALHMRGMNFTIPHKCAVIPFLDELSPAAAVIGAVNTVVVQEDGKLFGENTDGKGFVKSVLDLGESLTGKHITLLGAGGAARAIGVECALQGASHIDVVNRNAQRGEDVAQLIQSKTPASSCYIPWKGVYSIPEETDILINATSVGLYPDTSVPDVDFSTIRRDMLVCDIIPNPPLTSFLKKAKEAGAKTLDGLGMLVGQGAINFRLWTGLEPDEDVMMAAMKEEFGVE